MSAVRAELLHDRDELRAFLEREPALNLYALGDLAPGAWGSTCCYGLWREGALREVVLVYTGLALPVVMAFVEGCPEDACALLRAAAPALPPRFHAHLDPRCVEVAARRWEVRWSGHMLRLALYRPVPTPPLDPRIVPLGPAQADEIAAFLAETYPGNFFEPAMLTAGGWLGWREDGALLGVAGLHLCSDAMSVAALGNVAVHPGRRGRGLGAALTRALCASLAARGIRHVGLNVRADNAPARALYAGLGFREVLAYEEGFATWRGA
jgi:GNAT superfamily N-acetyltransferase